MSVCSDSKLMDSSCIEVIYLFKSVASQEPILRLSLRPCHANASSESAGIAVAGTGAKATVRATDMIEWKKGNT